MDAQPEIQILNGLYYHCLKSCDFIWTIYFESKINSKGGNFVTAKQKKFDLPEYLNYNKKKLYRLLVLFELLPFLFALDNFDSKEMGGKAA